MKHFLASNKGVPGPGAYHTTFHLPVFTAHQPVTIQCFFKGANKCSICGELQFGDYYQDGKKRRPICWCLPCFCLARPTMTLAYQKTVKKVRHCKFFHKHIDVENIVYTLVPPGHVRKLGLKEKSMWNKFGEMTDWRGLPI